MTHPEQIPQRPRPTRWLTVTCLSAALLLSWVLLRGQFAARAGDATAAAIPKVTFNEPSATTNADSSSTGTIENGPSESERHPLDQVLDIASAALADFQASISDYQAELVKRERIGDRLVGPQRMFIKVRNRKQQDGQPLVSFAVYAKFLQPDSIAGREIIWVEDRNDGKLIAHEAGLAGLLRVTLDPRGSIAMAGSRYPICNIGVQFLMEELIRVGARDREHDDCEVNISEATIEGRTCQMIEVRYPERRPYFDFFIARIFIDSEHNIPIRYAAYSWPTSADGEPVLEEEYTYLNVKLNAGLSEWDFDPDNDEYKFP